MLQLPPLMFTITVLLALIIGYVLGWRRGHITGHWCERDNSDEKRFNRGNDYEP